jgi:hypothetical protein
MQHHIPAVAFRSLSQGEDNVVDFVPHAYSSLIVPTELLAWLLQSLARLTLARVDTGDSAVAGNCAVLTQPIVTKVSVLRSLERYEACRLIADIPSASCCSCSASCSHISRATSLDV